MKIIFIRHGQTMGDVEDRYGGDYDDHLTALGVRQAEAVLPELKDKRIELIVSSPLRRAQETAQILSGWGCPVVIEPGFKERNQYGILTGMIKSQARTEHPDLAAKLQDRLNTITGAESYEDFSARIQKAFQGWASNSRYSRLAVVWHGGPMRVLFRDILKRGEIKKDIGDCGWVELEYKEGEFTVTDSQRIDLD